MVDAHDIRKFTHHHDLAFLAGVRLGALYGFCFEVDGMAAIWYLVDGYIRTCMHFWEQAYALSPLSLL